MEFSAIDLFSGAGGMSLGAMMAGIKVEVAIEFNKDAAETFKQNHPDAEVICDDIKKYSAKEHRDKFFILFGGPPCQGFSTSNTKTRNSENQNNSLFHEFVRIVEETKPKWFVFENVEGFVSFAKGETLKKLKEIFKNMGYETSEDVLVASDHGVPQRRNRFFMVGNSIGVKYTFPDKNNVAVSVEEAIKDLPSLLNGSNEDDLPYKEETISAYAKLMRGSSTTSKQNFVSKNKEYVIDRYQHIGPGENWKAIPPELMTNYQNTANCHSGIYRRLDPKKPSVVIANYRKNMLIHPSENRGLSVREAARIQSFPDSFLFKGPLMSQQQQIGNAVPPLLAKAIFDQIIKLTPDEHK